MPSAAGVTSSSSGRAPEKWLSTIAAVAIRAGQRAGIAVDAQNGRRTFDARSCRTMKRHAVSPFELLAGTIHVPAMAGRCGGGLQPPALGRP